MRVLKKYFRNSYKNIEHTFEFLSDYDIIG